MKLRELAARGAVAGFDLTFRAPKGVSVLFGICDEGVVEEIRLAHRAAVAEALTYMERHACSGRRGKGGCVAVKGAGFVAAAFEHRASRAGDPLLHTHVVVANMTLGPDGRWTALDGRLLYRHAKAAGYIYQAALRLELGRRLGLRFTAVDRGVADVIGMPEAVVDHFSKRRREILGLLHRRGEHSARAAQIATLASRRRKEYDVPERRLRERWRHETAELGLQGRRLDAILRPSPEREGVDVEAVAAELEGPYGLTRDRPTFTRREVVQAFAEAARDGGRLDDIEQQAEAFLARPGVVAVEAEGGERRYTTRELVEVERGLVDAASERRGVCTVVVGEAVVEQALGARPAVGEEQRALVRALVLGTDGVQVVRAAAGTGKTWALDAARDAWQSSGVTVIGCALAARAAAQLRDQAGIDATTIARLRRMLDCGRELELRSVLVVDEAGMVGTRDLAALSQAAEHAQAKLVLVGDDRQLPEIEAGGAFSALAESLGAVELHEVRRQRADWDRQALAELRAGDVERFAAAYELGGRLVTAPTAEQARSALVADWWVAHERGDRALMIAHRRRDVADLNERARSTLRSRGHLGAEVAEGFAIGDHVVTTRNERRVGAINGQAGEIVAGGDHGIEVRLDDGGEIRLPPTYVQAGHLMHGYAITAHRAQGATVDRTFVLGSDELYREWGYTALSRHREEARFYVTASARFLNEAPDRRVPARELVADQLAASHSQELASRGIER